MRFFVTEIPFVFRLSSLLPWQPSERRWIDPQGAADLREGPDRGVPRARFELLPITDVDLGALSRGFQGEPACAPEAPHVLSEISSEGDWINAAFHGASPAQGRSLGRAAHSAPRARSRKMFLAKRWQLS